jgi:hypothetical protein
MEPLKTIGYRQYNGTMSAGGYPGQPTFTPPDDEDATERPAYGWYPSAGTSGASSSQVLLGNIDYIQRIIRSKVVGVPDPSIYFPGDLVILDGVDYVVSEDVRDYRTGPFSPGPGGEIIVERVTG